jgi:hypothetical protein
MKRLYVGNLALDITEQEVREAFAQFGTVVTVTLAEDRHSGRPRGFGYVEMEEGDAAIAGLNRTDLRGQPLTVCAARPRNPLPVSDPLRVGRAHSPSGLGAASGIELERRAFLRRDGR